jgi:hypothetical protein
LLVLVENGGGYGGFVKKRYSNRLSGMNTFVLAILLQFSALAHTSSLPLAPSFPKQYACNVFIVSGGNISSPQPDGLLYNSVMYLDSSSSSAALLTQYGESSENQIFSWEEQQPKRFVRDDINSIFSATFCSAGTTSSSSFQGSLFLPSTEGLEYVSATNVNGRLCSLFVSSDSACFVLPVPVTPEQKLCGRQWLCSDDEGPVAFMVESTFSSKLDSRPAAAAAAVAQMSSAAATSHSSRSKRMHSSVAPTFPRAIHPQKFLRENLYRSSNSAAAAAAAHDKLIIVYDTCKIGPPSPSVFNMSHAKPCSGYSSCDRLDCPPPIKTIFGVKLCNPLLVPAGLIALALGLTLGTLLRRQAKSGCEVLDNYSLCFFTFGIMMTSGIFAHCANEGECNGPDSPYGKIYGLVDSSLTSFVAFLFLLNGLADLKVISSDPRSFIEKAGCGLVCIIGIYLSSNSPIVVLGFYTLTVVLFCGSYALIQLLIIFRTRTFHGFLWLVSAGVFGLVGLMGLDAFYCTLCTTLGGWSTEGLWYYLSDCRCVRLGFSAASLMYFQANSESL